MELIFVLFVSTHLVTKQISFQNDIQPSPPFCQHAQRM